MDRKEEELLEQLLPMFRAEAQDHLKVISSGLIEIEKDPGRQAETIEAVYREAHSLKGAARSVNLTGVVGICQSVENVFACFKRKELEPSAQVMDLLHRAIDCMAGIVAGDVSLSDKSGTGGLIHKLEEVIRKREAVSEDEGTDVSGKIWSGEPERFGDEPASETAAASTAPDSPAMPALGPDGTIRVSAAKLDELLLLAEEMLAIKLAAAHRASELKELKKIFVRWKKETAKSLKPAVGQGAGRKPADRGPEPFVPAFEAGLTKLLKGIESDQRFLGTMVDALLVDVKKTIMLPCSSLLELFPKLVRDLSRYTGKDVELSVEGGGIEMDRRVLELIKDPLIHLVRNCIDHGIETPREREKNNKARRGKIKIAVFSRDSRIEISVSDDGAGVDMSRLKSAAHKSGHILQDEIDGLGQDDALALAFRSGISTNRIVTDISGRGLGLAIVKEKVEKLGGTVKIDTRPGIGTTVGMVVPLTLATFRGVLVMAGKHLFIVPSANVERVSRIKEEQIKTVGNRATFSFNDRPVSLARLRDVLGLKNGVTIPGAGDSPIEAMMLVSGENHMVFLVDEVFHEQEFLIKGLGRQLSRVRNIAGAAVLGNGKVVPVLNASDLMISASKIDLPVAASAEEPQKARCVLVVEDSITARTLLKGILESAGYEVATAFDGVDAFTALKTGRFDLVVSDVEMPRMNGFELTAKIRDDRGLAELPVVLVTALESREDRERGIDVGANAYIVKSSFEQSNLLDVVRRLI